MSRPDRLGGPNPPAAPERGAASRALLVALGVGAIVRLVLLRLPRLWYDEATSGLLGLSVLRGELPVYFFGQSFMGALDGYLAAPLFWLLGVSARTLELVPALLALASVGLTVRLALDAFGPRAALFTAVLLAVPPDFLLFWSHEARNHYPLTILLGTLALLLALRAPAARGGRATVLFALLGGSLGLPSGPTSSPSSISRRSRFCSCAGDSARSSPASSRHCLRSRSAACRTGCTACRTGRRCRRCAGRWDSGPSWPISASSEGRPGPSWPACRRTSGTPRWALGSRSCWALCTWLPRSRPSAPSAVAPRRRERPAWPSSSSRAPPWASSWRHRTGGCSSTTTRTTSSPSTRRCHRSSGGFWPRCPADGARSP